MVANSQFISDAANLSFPNELRREIKKRKEECVKEGKEYDPGFDVDEFIVMDEFMDVVSGFREIEGRLEGARNDWTDEEIEILKQTFEKIGAMGIIKQNLFSRHNYGTIKMKAYEIGLKYQKCFKYIPCPDDDKILMENYSKYGKKVIDLLPHMTERQIEYRVKKLGLNIRNQWTEEEINILKKYYPIEGIKVVDRLSGKKIASIYNKATKLGILRNNWTGEENAILREYYPIEGTNVIKRLKGKTKSVIQYQAMKLGVKYKNHKYVYREGKKYVVMFSVNGKKMWFGTYDSEEEAAKVAMQKAKEYSKVI